MPQPTEWQHFGDQIDAAIVFTRADFVNVSFQRGIHSQSAVKA
jgi:hypothetical protein